MILAFGITIVLQLLGYSVFQMTGQVTAFEYLAMILSLIPFVIFILNLSAKSKQKKLDTLNEKERYEAEESYKQKIYKNYEKESRRVLFKFTAVNIIFALNILCALATAFFSAYYYVAIPASIFVIYDALKRVMQIPAGVKDLAVELPANEFKELDAAVKKCAEKMHCKKPKVYGEFCERIIIKDNDRLVLGTHLLPHLTEEQLSVLISREMVLNTLASRKVLFKQMKNKRFRGFTALFSAKGGSLYDRMTECEEFTDCAVYTEELIADKKVAEVYGAEAVTAALAVENTYRAFLGIKDPELIRILQTVPSKCSSTGDEFDTMFREYLNTRGARIESMLESKLSAPYDILPPVAARAELLGCDKVYIAEHPKNEISAEMKKLIQYVEIKTDEFISTHLAQRENKIYVKNINLTNAYEKSTSETEYTDAQLIRIARAYSKLGEEEKARTVLEKCFESEQAQDRAAAHYYYGKSLLSEDDSDGIKHIDLAAELDRNFSHGYCDVCKFAAQFGMDKVLEKYTVMYFDICVDSNALDSFIGSLNKDTPIFPSLIDGKTAEEIGNGLAGCGNGAVHSIYMVRIRYGRKETESNLVLVIFNPAISANYDEIKEDMHAYLNSRPEIFSLLYEEKIPSYLYIFLNKVPDCTIYKRK